MVGAYTHNLEIPRHLSYCTFTVPPVPPSLPSSFSSLPPLSLPLPPSLSLPLSPLLPPSLPPSLSRTLYCLQPHSAVRLLVLSTDPSLPFTSMGQQDLHHHPRVHPGMEKYICQHVSIICRAGASKTVMPRATLHAKCLPRNLQQFHLQQLPVDL